MLTIYSSLSGAFDIILLLAIFGAVGFVAYYIRKTFYPAPWESKRVDPKTAAKEELERILVPLDQPLTASKEEEASKPTPQKTKKLTPSTVKKRNANGKRQSS